MYDFECTIDNINLLKCTDTSSNSDVVENFKFHMGNIWQNGDVHNFLLKINRNFRCVFFREA